MRRGKRRIRTRWSRAGRRARLVVLLTIASLLSALWIMVVGGYGQGSQPPNDLFALGQGTGDAPATVPVQQNAEPPFVATPAPAKCDPGSKPEPTTDGRVPEGSAKDGLSCNVQLIAHQGTEGGFKVFRYIDTHGHECAFYDSTLLLPLNALNPGAGSEGVIVLDMSNPAHPVQTDDLTTPPMLSPHESVNLNVKRGLLAAVNGNPATEPGFVSIYDVHDDCRHPVLDANGPFARLGHESGFSADGKTFYATSTAFNAITAIDVTDPKNPHAVWQGNIYSHGMSLSDDGNRAYIADPGFGNGNNGGATQGDLLILDTSQIQARKADPHAREISRLTWKASSIPQNAIPFTENGHPYLLEIDEYTQATLRPGGDPDMVGAARIIDIADETKPVVVANLRLAIDQPAEHKAATDANDPGTGNGAQGYAGHYCNVPTEVDPKIVACSFIASGLRLFDISNITHPKEVGYYVAPPQPRSENGETNSDFAMSKPAFAPERREVWWTDGTSGFYVLRVNKDVWPQAASRSGCSDKRRFKFKLHHARRARIVRVEAFVNGKRVLTRRGHNIKTITIARRPQGHFTVKIVSTQSNGSRLVSIRTYDGCSKGRPTTRGHHAHRR